jgi:hypothetical protein
VFLKKNPNVLRSSHFLLAFDGQSAAVKFLESVAVVNPGKTAAMSFFFQLQKSKQPETNSCPSAGWNLATSEIQEIKRSSSGGYCFLRKRSAEAQERISRARAQELAEIFETSDHKNDQLEKNPKFKTTVVNPPSLSMPITAQQAAATYSNKKDAYYRGKLADPLLAEHEQAKLQHDQIIERRKLCIESQLSPAGQLSMPPSIFRLRDDSTLSNTSSSSSSLSKSVLHVDTAIPEGKGFEVAEVSPGVYSVAETAPETPDSCCTLYSYRAANGQVYEVPNMC